MAMGGCPTNLDIIRQFLFFSRGRGEQAVRQALQQRHLYWMDRAAHSTEQQNMLRGHFFSFQLIQTKFGVPTGQYSKWPPTNFDKNWTIINDH